MKQLSNRLRTLINRLQTLSVDQKDLLGRLNQTTIEQAVDLINQIAHSGEFLAVICLVQYLAARSEDVARSAVDAIEMLLQEIYPEHLLQLDLRIRSGTWSVPAHLCLWDGLKYATLQRHIAKDGQVGLVGVASLHRSGYVRQDAVADLSAIDSGRELPYLLMRLSDWVPAVRQCAERAVAQRIKSDYLQHFVDNLALIERVKERQRHPGESRRLELIERMYLMLQMPANFDLLLSSLKHQNLAVRRNCLRLLLDVREPNITAILPHVVDNGDTVIRRQAAELALRLDLPDRTDTMERLLQDKTPSIRCQGLRGLCTAGGDMVGGHLRAALLDASSTVRQYAVWQLATLEPDFDFRRFYADRLVDLSEPRTLATVVAGLGEIGVPADGQLAVPLIDHPRVVVQKSAVRALAKLDPDHHTASFLRLLGSDSPGVSRAAQKALERTKNLVAGSTLWQVCLNSRHWHVKRNALILINKLEKWDRICHLLLALAQDDERLKALAIRFLQAWHWQYKTTWGFTRPNSKQQEMLLIALRDSSNTIPGHLGETLAQCLKTCK